MHKRSQHYIIILVPCPLRMQCLALTGRSGRSPMAIGASLAFADTRRQDNLFSQPKLMYTKSSLVNTNQPYSILTHRRQRPSNPLSHRRQKHSFHYLWLHRTFGNLHVSAGAFVLNVSTSCSHFFFQTVIVNISPNDVNPHDGLGRHTWVGGGRLSTTAFRRSRGDTNRVCVGDCNALLSNSTASSQTNSCLRPSSFVVIWKVPPYVLFSIIVICVIVAQDTFLLFLFRAVIQWLAVILFLRTPWTELKGRNYKIKYYPINALTMLWNCIYYILCVCHAPQNYHILSRKLCYSLVWAIFH